MGTISRRLRAFGAPLPCALLLCGAPVLADEPNIKCWTNAEGVRECGNVLPPEYAQQGHELVSDHGLTRAQTEPARSAEELRAEREAAAEAAEARRRAEEQARRDRILLDTFPTEDDVLLARDAKLTNLDLQIQLTESRVEKLDHNLNALIREAARLERMGKAVPEGLSRDIGQVREQVARQEAYIAAKQEEKQALREEYAGYLERVRAIRSREDADAS